MANIDDLVTLARSIAEQEAGKDSAGWLTVWGFFVVRRGTFYFTNQGWAAADPQLKPRLLQEKGKIETFVLAELADPANPGGRTPAHLDLEEVLKTRENLTAATVKPLVTKAQELRKLYVTKIVIRALAAHFELWDQGEIRAAATREILDRRLRLVEQMYYHVNPPGEGGRAWKTVSAENWTDGALTRLFEYPNITDNPQGLSEAAEQANLDLDLAERTALNWYRQSAGNDWNWIKLMQGSAIAQFAWDRPPPYPEDIDPNDPPNVFNNQVLTNIRLPTAELRQAFKVSDSDMHTLRFFGGTSPTSTQLSLVDAIDGLLANDGTSAEKKNYWKRAWLYCDHVISALHLEALLFARRRRTGRPAANTEINALAIRATGANPEHSKFVWLGPMVTKESTSVSVSTGLLDGRTNNQFFETRLRSIDQLEIGDQVVFWNSAIYDVLTGGALRLENATIMDLDAKADGSLDLNKLWLAGHGMWGSLSGYRTEFMTTINRLLIEARALIRSKGAPSNQNVIQVELPTHHRMIRWAPYAGLRVGDTIGPWWLVYPLKSIPDSPFLPRERTVDKAVQSIPGTIGVKSADGTMTLVTANVPAAGRTGAPQPDDIETGAGFTPFSQPHPTVALSEHVLFPLTRPVIHGEPTISGLNAWGRYLTLREEGPVNPKLMDMTVDGSAIPGIELGNREVWMTYPKPRP
jgi:hypothetical protein